MADYRTRQTQFFDGLFEAAPVFIILLWLAAIGGWIANVVKVFASSGDPITGFFIFRCIGVFIAPLGSVLGFL